MKATATHRFVTLILLTLIPAAGANADSLEELYTVGNAGRVHQAGGAFLPVFDNNRSQTGEPVFLLHGGYPQELDAEPVGDVWVLVDGHWEEMTIEAPAMADHALIAGADGRAYAFGGIGSDDWLSDMDSVTTFELRRQYGLIEVVVDQIDIPGPAPDSCFDASATSVDHGRGIMYIGGMCGFNPLDEPLSRQVWEYRIESNRWHRRADMPEGLSGHSAVSARDFVWVFGGKGPNSLSNEVYRYDTLTDAWTTIDTVGSQPDPRENHGAAVAGNTMVVLGGIVRPFFPETLDDIWELDLDTLAWTEKRSMDQGLADMTVAVIPAQSSASPRVQVLMYGGVIDAWSFPLDLSNSTAIYTTDTTAARRPVARSAYDR